MKINDAVKVNEKVYSSLSDIEQLLIDLNLKHNHIYEVEDIALSDKGEVIFLKELTNIGFDSIWFKKL